jgi:MYXO-CTERM domain-containing protein
MARFTLALVLLSLFAAPASAQRCSVPRVMLTVDRSSSMLGLAADGLTKWDAAETAIGEVTMAYEGRIDFGLQVFPYPNRCEPGHVVLDFGMHASGDVVDALGGPPPSAGNYTPMAQTLDEAAAALTTSGEGVHLILVTDGWQWCDPYDASTRFTPVAAVERLRALGVTVHVVGFGASVDPLTLNRAAVAAGTARPGCDPTLSDPAAPNQCYEQVGDMVELRAALEAIAREVTAEDCDGVDDDCDGLVDEGYDVDGDGYTVCGTDEEGTDPTLVDCVDEDATIHPGADETCNAVDDDCDGAIDPGCDCTDGEVVACGATEVGECAYGTASCTGGSWGACEGEVVMASELCNGLDDDCDGEIDDHADGTCGAGRACLSGECVDITPDEPEMPMTPPDETVPPPIRGSCGCAVPTTSGRGAGLALGALGLLLAAIRRRR